MWLCGTRQTLPLLNHPICLEPVCWRWSGGGGVSKAKVQRSQTGINLFDWERQAYIWWLTAPQQPTMKTNLLPPQVLLLSCHNTSITFWACQMDVWLANWRYLQRLHSKPANGVRPWKILTYVTRHKYEAFYDEHWKIAGGCVFFLVI